MNLRDLESGWTPLHRALECTPLHIRTSLLLMRHGATLGDELSVGRPWLRLPRHTTTPLPPQRQQGQQGQQGHSTGTPHKSKGGSKGGKGQQSAQAQPRNGAGCDNDGHTPLSLLSMRLRNSLRHHDRTGGDVYSFGKADFHLGFVLRLVSGWGVY